ncbi:helix-turn-helix transcriptional regulator [Actinoplanes sp. DH11]|uniref:helix-turn-helix domain-containing protein n=1 Tax=Actinoplanes sp. DH11 TaxID=2857011 RepID=UPI001E612370|nr:helix-turn-helix transcriptional regulator [Actinoplanes sp. DH11]
MLAPHLQETLECLAAGETAREMAARLFISPNTVKSRLKTLYQQLGARDQAHAVAIAFRLGILRATDDPHQRPVVIGGLNPDRLRTTIADLTALLRMAEHDPDLPDYQEVLREVAALATNPHTDPHATLRRIASMAGGASDDPVAAA